MQELSSVSVNNIKMLRLDNIRTNIVQQYCISSFKLVSGDILSGLFQGYFKNNFLKQLLVMNYKEIIKHNLHIDNDTALTSILMLQKIAYINKLIIKANVYSHPFFLTNKQINLKILKKYIITNKLKQIPSKKKTIIEKNTKNYSVELSTLQLMAEDT